MEKYYEAFVAYIGNAYTSSWHWINGLDRQSWLVLLVITTAFGLLCMRGFGSRNSY